MALAADAALHNMASLRHTSQPLADRRTSRPHPPAALPLPRHCCLQSRVSRHQAQSRRALTARAVLSEDAIPPAPAPAPPQASTSSSPCCSSPEAPATPEFRDTSAAAAAVTGGSSSDFLQKAFVAGALLSLPLAVAALNPSLLPFDLYDLQDWLDEAVYFASQEVNRAVNAQLGGSPLSPPLLSLVFGAGLLSSFAPCTLSVLPLTIGYIAGFGKEGEKQSPVLLNASVFSLGLASTFAVMGVSAALAGKAYGSIGPGLPIAVSGITMAMGLNLLGVVRFQLPSFFADWDPKEAAASLPAPVQMYLGGMAFALLASPCSTPVLASLLGYVASTEDVAVGGLLLLAYTFGRVMPLLAAASATGSMRQMLGLKEHSRWVTPASGALLLGIGTFSLLNRVFPEATAMAAGSMGM